jgi:hypothetical protein
MERVEKLLQDAHVEHAHGLCVSVLDGLQSFAHRLRADEDITALALVRRLST